MKKPPKPDSTLLVLPLTEDRWDDFAALFGSNGACGGCWCMWWRLQRSIYNAQKGNGTKRAMKNLVRKGPPPGLLVYKDGKTIGWCSLAPREDFSALTRSRILAPVDDKPVWSVVCFFIAKEFRKQEFSASILREAARYAFANGAVIVEGYPSSPARGITADAFVYTGLHSTFLKAGFTEVARRSATRPIMRLVRL